MNKIYFSTYYLPKSRPTSTAQDLINRTDLYFTIGNVDSNIVIDEVRD